MIDYLLRSFNTIKSCYLHAIKLEIENLFLTIVIFGTGLFLLSAGYIINSVFLSGNPISLSMIFAFMIIVFLTLFNAKRCGYVIAVDTLRQKRETHFYVLMDGMISNIGYSFVLATIQVVSFLSIGMLSVFLVKKLLPPGEDFITVFYIVAVIMLFFLIVLNELFLVPLLMVMALRKEGILQAFKRLSKRAISFLVARLVYLVIITAIGFFITVTVFLILPPLVFFLILYPILIMSHINDFSDILHKGERNPMHQKPKHS